MSKCPCCNQDVPEEPTRSKQPVTLEQEQWCAWVKEQVKSFTDGALP